MAPTCVRFSSHGAGHSILCACRFGSLADKTSPAQIQHGPLLDKADGVGRPLRRKVIATSRPKIHADIASFTLRFGVSRKPQLWSNSGRTRALSDCPLCAASRHPRLPTNIPQAASAGGVSTRRVVGSWVHGQMFASVADVALPVSLLFWIAAFPGRQSSSTTLLGR